MGICSNIAKLNGSLFAGVNDSVFQLASANWDFFHASPEADLLNFNVSENELLISEQINDTTGTLPVAQILVINPNFSTESLTDSRIVRPFQAAKQANGTYWVADLLRGLIKVEVSSATSIIPNGPFSESVWDIDIHDSKVLVAAGGVTSSWGHTGNGDGFYMLDEGWWNNYNQYSTTWLDDVIDMVTILIDPSDNTVYTGSYWAGLVEWRKGEDGTLWNPLNSSLGVVVGDPQRTRVAGLALDDNGNLWVSNNGAENLISVKRTDNSWQSFKVPLSFNVASSGKMLVDDFDQKWMIVPTGNGSGIVVFNHGSSIEDVSDDQYYQYKTGEGLGNLPNTKVKAMALDNDGSIWLGTQEGIAVVHCPGQVFNGGCDAQQILVQQDGFNGFLLANEVVAAIAVDAGNRKWVGSANGLWLFSADGTEQLAFFNKDNSPLFSNNILAIDIDHQTGEVFIGTDKGLISLRGEAIAGEAEHTDVYAFPNPVEPGYAGPIAITGLVQDADVKITDVSGTLIYQTIAYGGQAIWDGHDPSGRKANTGVYLVFSTNEDGTEKFVTKLLFIQ